MENPERNFYVTDLQSKMERHRHHSRSVPTHSASRHMLSITHRHTHAAGSPCGSTSHTPLPLLRLHSRGRLVRFEWPHDPALGLDIYLTAASPSCRPSVPPYASILRPGPCTAQPQTERALVCSHTYACSSLIWTILGISLRPGSVTFHDPHVCFYCTPYCIAHPKLSQYHPC